MIGKKIIKTLKAILIVSLCCVLAGCSPAEGTEAERVVEEEDLITIGFPSSEPNPTGEMPIPNQ